MTSSLRRRPVNAVLVGWAAALGLLALAVRAGALGGFDTWCGGWAASLRAQLWDAVARGITAFGGSLFTSAAVLGLALMEWRRSGMRAAAWFVGIFAAGLGVALVLRWSVAQWRPDLLIPPGADAPLLARLDLAGFPSGHAYRSAFIFGHAARRLPSGRWAPLARAGCVLLIALVGLTRIYLNRHWVSDVVGGWLVALVALELSARHVKCQALNRERA